MTTLQLSAPGLSSQQLQPPLTATNSTGCCKPWTGGILISGTSSSRKLWTGSSSSSFLSCTWKEGGTAGTQTTEHAVRKSQVLRESTRVGAGEDYDDEDGRQRDEVQVSDPFQKDDDVSREHDISPEELRQSISGGDSRWPTTYSQHNVRVDSPRAGADNRRSYSARGREGEPNDRFYGRRDGADNNQRYYWARGRVGEYKDEKDRSGPQTIRSGYNDVWINTKARVDVDENRRNVEMRASSPKERLDSDSSWQNRRAAMVEVQTADNIRDALCSVGGQLETSDLNAVLRRFGRLGKWEESCVLFDWMKENDKLSPPSYTSFFSVLGKAGKSEKALSIFLELKDKELRSNLYVWNSLLSTLISNGKVDKAFHFFRTLREEGLEPDRITYSTMIAACSRALGGYYKAQKLVKDMREKGFKLDSVMYGALINVCATNYMVAEARATFRDMKAQGFVPNLFHYSSLLNAYALKGKHEDAESVLLEIKQAGLRPNKVIYNSLINAYARGRKADKARETFNEMSQYGLQPDLISYCSLMDAYSKAGQVEEAHAVFDQMKEAGLKPGSNGYSILIAAYGKLGNLDMIKKLMEEINATIQYDVDVHLFNSLLKVYCHAGVMDSVMDILRKMDKLACPPNRITFHVLMAYFCKENLCDLAIRTFQDMESKGYSANETSYTIVIQGYLKHGKVKDCLELLKQMQDCGISPTKAIYQDMLSACISLKMFSEAQGVFENLKASKYTLSRTVFETYLQAFAEDGMMEVVLDILQEMNKIDESPGQELWDLLLLKADEQGKNDVLKTLLENPGCKPTPKMTDILLDRFKESGRAELLHRLEIHQQLEQVS